MIMKHIKYLESLHACDGGIAYASRYKSLREAWDNCRRIDWIVWLLNVTFLRDSKRYRQFACWCVRNTPLGNNQIVWDLLTDERSRNAVVVAEKYASDGMVTWRQLISANNAAHAVIYENNNIDEESPAYFSAAAAVCASKFCVDGYPADEILTNAAKRAGLAAVLFARRDKSSYRNQFAHIASFVPTYTGAYGAVLSIPSVEQVELAVKNSQADKLREMFAKEFDKIEKRILNMKN
jgi:hypothetical protein